MTDSQFLRVENFDEASKDLPIDEGTSERLARRPWPATPIKPDIEVSFEFFPAATEAGNATLEATVEQLAPLDPSFVSVTYGAGGSSQAKTLSTLEHITSNTDLSVAGHLTCVGATKAQVHEVIDRYLELGVNRIVALRGDAPADGSQVEGGYQTAADLVAAIRERDDDIDISVAAYPEVHPKAASAAADMDNLKRKFDAGADRALTQYFFDTDAFLRFLHQARAAGISQPIVPGLMPVTNFAKVKSFSERCGTIIPEWMPELFSEIDDAPEVRHLVAATVAAEQSRRLVEHGVRQLHFYTMNRHELTAATCRILGMKAKSSDVVDVRKDKNVG